MHLIYISLNEQVRTSLAHHNHEAFTLSVSKPSATVTGLTAADTGMNCHVHFIVIISHMC